MTSDFGSIEKNSFAKFIFGKSIPTPSQDGEADAGDISRLPTTTPEAEGLESYTLSKVDSVTTWSTTNSFTCLRNGSGQEEIQLPDEMKKSMLRFLTRLQEDLFVNLENSTEGLCYEKQKTAEKNTGGHSPIDVRAC